ncbi:MAG: CDP-glycerol glycerophosphotransferase family protein, partial [Lachnospiraceae bacterium]|nr:CDP-glycerol glycerophosphotransferase family protein [Lachnospiraceae bacterium]
PHMANDITTYRMFGLDHYDAILLSGEYQKDQIRKLEALRKLPEKEIELVGIPYMDVMKERVEKAGKPAEHTRTVLLAPSWGASGILSKFGERAIDALIATGYKIIIRPHPQSFKSEKEMLDRLMSKYPDGEKVSWNRDTDNFEVLRNSDILISDFSGVIFDFTLIFDKPVIYADTSFDKSPYDAWWLDEELWTFEILPEMGLQLTEDGLSNIKELIDKCIEDPTFKAGRDKARRETWVHEGEGAVRTVDYLLAKYDSLMVVEEEKRRKEEAEYEALLAKKKKKAEKKAAKKGEKQESPAEEQTVNEDKQ